MKIFTEVEVFLQKFFSFARDVEIFLWPLKDISTEVKLTLNLLQEFFEYELATFSGIKKGVLFGRTGRSGLYSS